MLKPSHAGVVFQEAVNGHGRKPRSLFHSLGCATRGCRKADAQAAVRKDVNESPDDRCFSNTRSAGNN